jgi:hypothetical protein
MYAFNLMFATAPFWYFPPEEVLLHYPKNVQIFGAQSKYQEG